MTLASRSRLLIIGKPSGSVVALASVAFAAAAFALAAASSARISRSALGLLKDRVGVVALVVMMDTRLRSVFCWIY